MSGTSGPTRARARSKLPPPPPSRFPPRPTASAGTSTASARATVSTPRRVSPGSSNPRGPFTIHSGPPTEAQSRSPSPLRPPPSPPLDPPPRLPRLKQPPRPLHHRLRPLERSPIQVPVPPQHRQHHVSPPLPQPKHQPPSLRLETNRVINRHRPRHPQLRQRQHRVPNKPPPLPPLLSRQLAPSPEQLRAQKSLLLVHVHPCVR